MRGCLPQRRPISLVALLTRTLARFQCSPGRRRHSLLLSVENRPLEFLSTPRVLREVVFLLPRLARLYLHCCPPEPHCPL